MKLKSNSAAPLLKLKFAEPLLDLEFNESKKVI